jgi:ferredoxin
MLAAPLVLGRAFCGYACPLGFVVEALGPKDGRRGPSWLRRWPVFVLIASAGLLLFGSAAYLVFDPLSLFTRSATTLAYPLADRAARLVGDLIYVIAPARPAVDAATTSLAGLIIFARPLAYRLAFGILAMLGGVVVLSWVEPRLWCRHLCPLGALLGTVGRGAATGRVVDAETCIRCGACEKACPLGAISREDPTVTDTTRCQLGFECADVCPVDAVRYGRAPAKANPGVTRREFLVAGGLSLAGGFFVYNSVARREPNVWLVRPPGGRKEVAFLGLCSRCGQCMKVCPTNVIQPAVTAAGLEGVFTPQMDFERGYCDWSCNECGKVCPTGAIEALTLPAKRQTVIGRAYIDRSLCIPWMDFKDCLVCEELCPTPKKAIVFQRETVLAPSGATVTLKRPWVIGDLCIGCGICEHNCPVPNEAAIRVRARSEL